MRLAISIGLALLTIALAASAGFAQESSARDWLVPPLVLPDRIQELSTPSGAPAPCPSCGATVSYTAFDNAQYTRTRYAGRHTEWLLPASWIAALSPSELRLLLERSDWLYEHARELVGREPTGAGRIAFAVIPTTCGYGCAWIGARGVEVDDEALADVRNNLAAGVLAGVIVHELTHNFDVYNARLFPSGVGVPDAHAWTDLIQMYLGFYSRMGTDTLAPEAHVAAWLKGTYEAYLVDPNNDWPRCIARTGACTVSANSAWSGVTHRFAQLHGVEALRRALAFVRDTGAPATNLQAAADLHFSALAQGAKQNVGCYAGPWRWSVSAPALAALGSLPATANCADSDNDGFTPLLGDCANTNATRHPNALETLNAVDDDCNGVVDDTRIVESGDFAPDLLHSFPGRIQGAISAGDDDSFQFDLSAPSEVEFTLCSQGFQGWLFVYDTFGGWLDYQYVFENECTARNYFLDQARRWRFSVSLNNQSLPGAYTVAYRAVSPWPAAPWGTAIAPTINQCTVTLRATTTSLASASKNPNRARFFIEGVGTVGDNVYNAAPSLAWLPGRSTSGTYQYRAQLMNGKEPVTDWSAPMTFAFSEPAAGCGAPCDDGIDNDGDGLTDWPNDPACRFPGSATEAPACDDGLDNDGDGARDWDGAGVGAADSYCNNPWVTAEAPPPTSCGFGPELALVLALVSAFRRARVHR